MPLRASPCNTFTGANRSPNEVSSKTNFVGKCRYVTDAFRNVRVTPQQAHNFCYKVDDVLVSDFRLRFEGAASPGYWSLMATITAIPL